MPKPIKKRVTKKVDAEKEVRTIYEIALNYYRENKRFVHLLVFAVVIVFLLSFITFSYIRSKSEKAHELTYEGYKIYSGLYGKKADNKALEDALKRFKEAYEKESSAETLYYIALTEYKLGKLSDALKDLDSLISKFKKDEEILPLAYLKKATILLKQDKKDEALKTLDALFNEANTPYLKDVALFEQARILEAMERTEEAKKKYELLTKKFPTSPYKVVAEAKIKPPEEEKKEEKSEKEQKKDKELTGKDDKK